MIISRTPFRISFFGGGTDYPGWYLKNGGAVLSTSFDKYCYITCRELPPFFDHKYRIAYSRVENALTADSIEHPAVRAVISQMEINEGLEIHCDADLPARSGLGSSSSFVVGLLNALKAYKGIRVSKQWLAKEAIRIEQEVLAESVGSQDQTAAAFGGMNVIHFDRDGGIRVEPVICSRDRVELLNDHLMLFFTGFSRIASEVAKAQVQNISKKEADLHRMRTMVDEGLEILCENRDIREFGELLHLGWTLKRGLSEKVSNDQIDALYERARIAGAVGGKLLGAGAGGFMLLFVEPSRRNEVKAALSELIHVPFRFENSGAQVVYYQP
ncbi:kinase [Permianibacter aggregans]|uniref:D-glycero-alpha-D-manno-heptose-7-phosphate kinase n=1 Tax=Permianibacter aggregans TaxID=1510150 RepID=A0A4R6UV78_9GAMM|nr:kinase [Permianibacter aggregans]QGX41336.1 kinase [Permianibacter aggregans]TDQ51122.1 D-glycero-alpha-D-manno-heptose-7-phosphate kinase [Permianibacter aggregans]